MGGLAPFVCIVTTTLTFAFYSLTTNNIADCRSLATQTVPFYDYPKALIFLKSTVVLEIRCKISAICCTEDFRTVEGVRVKSQCLHYCVFCIGTEVPRRSTGVVRTGYVISSTAHNAS